MKPSKADLIILDTYFETLNWTYKPDQSVSTCDPSVDVPCNHPSNAACEPCNLSVDPLCTPPALSVPCNPSDPIVSLVTFGAFMDILDMDNRWVYKGSMTTPPCKEGVYWNVLNDVYPIKQKYID